MNVDELKSISYSIVPVFEDDDFALTEEFHEYTKLNQESFHALAKRVATITTSKKIRTMMTRGWKTYRGNERVALLPPNLGNVGLQEVIERRRSLSSIPGALFGSRPVTLEQLSSVLGLSYGVTHTHPLGDGGKQHFRASASAGALYPLEVYALIFNVDGLTPGLYHYSPTEHVLEVVRRESCQAEFLTTTTYKDLCSTCAVALVITGVFRRNLSKYLNRGYRFLLHDVGTLLQSLYLTGTGAGLATCAMAGFFDDQLGNVLGVNNVDEAPLMCFLMGQTTKQ